MAFPMWGGILIGLSFCRLWGTVIMCGHYSEG